MIAVHATLQPTGNVYARTAASLPRAELLASARRRIDDLSAIYGTDSPQVRAVLARWERIANRRPEPDDVMAMVDATCGGSR